MFARELASLFVDDGKFALAIVLWLAIVRSTVPRLAPNALWAGALLFVGLAAILVERTCRHAWKFLR